MLLRPSGKEKKFTIPSPDWMIRTTMEMWSCWAEKTFEIMPSHDNCVTHHHHHHHYCLFIPPSPPCQCIPTSSYLKLRKTPFSVVLSSDCWQHTVKSKRKRRHTDSVRVSWKCLKSGGCWRRHNFCVWIQTRQTFFKQRSKSFSFLFPSGSLTLLTCVTNARRTILFSVCIFTPRSSSRRRLL